MLIPSHRHTPEDLELWREHERADLLRGQSLGGKIREAIDCITAFASQPCSVSTSWGKDSTVLACLSVAASESLPIVWVRWNGFDNPDSQSVCDAFCERFPQANVQEVFGPDDDADDGKQGFRKSASLFGIRRIMGIRQNESACRKISAAVHGVATANTCRPLLHWTAADIFACLAVLDLPVHPAYAMIGKGRWDREQIRVDTIGGTRGDGIGRVQWEQEYYGDVLRRLQKR